MSKSTLNQFHHGFEKKRVVVYARVTGNTTSTPVLYHRNMAAVFSAAPAAGTRGVKSITRNGTGDLTFTFWDRFQALLFVNMVASSLDNSTAPLVTKCWVKDRDPNIAGGGTVRLVTYLDTTGTPVDAGTNDELLFEFTFADTSAL
jgi:hypothetical protein